MTPEQLFWKYVDKSGDCWLWTTSKDRGGYGLANQNHWPSRMAHRIAYELMVGPIPAGMEIDHLCRTRHCVNPAHLEVVTHEENMRRVRDSRTHCSQGHEYTAENKYRRPSGYYSCRACNRDAARLRQGYYERRSA